ncbi:hypothetical protein BTO32_15395 [Marinobacter lutaoensis]|uniref:Uncharacterized protein n=1 Tax=Marinobacter lutaoensis TaxID=135739 RepID=A0A1V2DQ08_9GAMM|nr:hypothetical protein [Marinobacter lutaoensis]ONF42590.1 hypothetical protein BTO32_15395 [Marinobacter lutaoensis]
MDKLNEIALAHYGKLLVFGGGLVMMPSLFELQNGSPVAPEPWIGMIWLTGCTICGTGIVFWKKSVSGY